MKLTIDDIRAVVELADRSSFRRAAEALSLTQPAFSRRIAKTEAYLETVLFERTTQRVTLSTTGREFVSRARVILNDLEHFDADMKALAGGVNAVIEMACMRTVSATIMPHLVRRFRDTFGRVKFKVREDNGLGVIEKVANHEVEFGIAVAIPDSPDLDFEPLVRVPFILSCSPEHPLWGETPISWREIADEGVSFVGGAAANHLLVSRVLSEHGINVRWNNDIEFLSIHLGFVDEGIVALVLPRLGLAFGKNPRLCARPMIDPPIEGEIGIFTRPNWKPGVACARFLDFVRGSFAAQYAEVTQG